MTHTADHNPTRDHETCGVCEVALRRAFTMMADLPLGPIDAAALVDTLRSLAAEDIDRAGLDAEDDHTQARLEDLRRFTNDDDPGPFTLKPIPTDDPVREGLRRVMRRAWGSPDAWQR